MMKSLSTYILLFALLFCSQTGAEAQKPRKKKLLPKPAAKEDPTAKRLADKLAYTEKTLVFDSLVTNTYSDLALPHHLGSVTSYARVFGKQAPDTWRAYLNEFKDYCVFSQADSTGNLQLYTTHLIGTTWTKPSRIKDFDGMFTDITCPYVSEDGSTLYFAAKGPEGLGGYDIYRTNYDTEDNRYMEPQSLGLPFNSTANDYYCITSETDSLTWLVTDRRQPSGKQCIYYCLTRQPRLDYNADGLTTQQLLSLAEIQRIDQTWALWDKKTDRPHAQARLNALNKQQTSRQTQTMHFWVNDRTVYSSPTQFRSHASRELYTQLQAMQQEANSKRLQLDTLRQKYDAGSAATRQALKAEITRTERQVEQLDITIAQTEKRIRNNENQSLK